MIEIGLSLFGIGVSLAAIAIGLYIWLPIIHRDLQRIGNSLPPPPPNERTPE